MNPLFSGYYQGLPSRANLSVSGPLSQDAGYFRCGQDNVCYGRSASGSRHGRADAALYDTLDDAEIKGSTVALPFDLGEVIENLRRERYCAHFREEKRFPNNVIRSLYYLVRPYLSVPVRKQLQKFHLRHWNSIPFPAWPVDFTVDRLHRQALSLFMRAQGVETMPFIWFWPDNCASCAIVTHDVEDPIGQNYCPQLMDIDEAYGFRSSFQVVPEDRYPVSDEYLASIVDRGFEVNVHDLKHDGLLFVEHDEFLKRAERINEYGRRFNSTGFRAGIMYRNADWYDALDFQYDMSIPNVAHLDPQRGGCCTVMPYFIGDMVELPLTCTQDYTLFNILGDYTTSLWEKQIEMIMANNGLITILVHPDYIIEPRASRTYKALLSHLSSLRDSHDIWTPLPRDVASWWRQRSQMQMVYKNGSWRVEGPGSERACVAYACQMGDTVSYSLAGAEAETVAVAS